MANSLIHSYHIVFWVAAAKLTDAAAAVFAARGLDATLDDIARHAGVNVATAYRHFANKHELAREYLRQCVDRAVASCSSGPPRRWNGCWPGPGRPG